MTREIIWTWAAETDAQAAFMRREASAPDAGLRFVTTTDRLLSLLQSFPFLAAMWHPPVRRALIRRSNYGLFYVVELRRLVIIGVQDLRRDLRRLEEDILQRLP